MFAEGTKILTPKGFVKIEDLQPDQKFYNHRGELLSVKRIKKKERDSIDFSFGVETYEKVKGKSKPIVVAVRYVHIFADKKQAFFVTGESRIKSNYDLVSQLTNLEVIAENEKKQNQEKGTNIRTNQDILKEFKEENCQDSSCTMHKIKRNYKIFTKDKTPVHYENHRLENKTRVMYQIIPNNTTSIKSCVSEEMICAYIG